jgi:hypothetical protein
MKIQQSPDPAVRISVSSGYIFGITAIGQFKGVDYLSPDCYDICHMQLPEISGEAVMQNAWYQY